MNDQQTSWLVRHKPSVEVQVAFGTVSAAVNIVSTVLAVQDIARLPLSVLAAVSRLGFVAVFFSVVLSQRGTIAALRATLDRRNETESGLLEINERIIEGNGIARKLKRYRPPVEPTMAMLDVDKDGFTQMVREWNARCWETANRHMQYMAGSLDAPIPPRVDPPRMPGVRSPRPIYWQLSLGHEVSVKISRLQEIQQRLANR